MCILRLTSALHLLDPPAPNIDIDIALQGLDEADEEKKMENLYTGQGVGVEEDGDDDEDEVDGNVSRLSWSGGEGRGGESRGGRGGGRPAGGGGGVLPLRLHRSYVDFEMLSPVGGASMSKKRGSNLN